MVMNDYENNNIVTIFYERLFFRHYFEDKRERDREDLQTKQLISTCMLHV